MESARSSFHARAYAKINLVLAVGLGDAPGGLHPICSWMHAINLFDKIEIDRLDGGNASVYELGWTPAAESGTTLQPVEWAIEDDLAVRAHRLVESLVGACLPIRLRVSKSIPAGGGLGGGSSDAARVLVGINQVFDLGLHHQQLCDLGFELGSDIPFFLDQSHQIPRPAIVEGCGEHITRLKPTHDGTAITLFLPGFGCPTGRVYQRFDESIGAQHTLDEPRVRRCAGLVTIDNAGLFNDLAAPAEMIEPELGVLLRRLGGLLDRTIHVSGSGSTLFVIGSCRERQHLDELSDIGCRSINTALCSGPA